MPALRRGEKELHKLLSGKSPLLLRVFALSAVNFSTNPSDYGCL